MMKIFWLAYLHQQGTCPERALAAKRATLYLIATVLAFVATVATLYVTLAIGRPSLATAGIGVAASGVFICGAGFLRWLHRVVKIDIRTVTDSVRRPTPSRAHTSDASPT
jgi:hypothetical protein